MRTWRKSVKLAAMATLAGCLVMTGTSAAVADHNAASAKTSSFTCGSQVFLDGLRALTISENGHDEVYITNNAGVKIWPVTAAYVSMAAGQRVEVDKCVPANEYLTLWEEDTADFDDHIGGIS